MNYVVAVSGGVDSVVLLDMMAKYKQTNRLVVAHFDHGIRDDSAADARFVAALAEQYKLPFEVRREELGAGASEALARERRYVFLRDIAKKYNATIVTAHHQSDLIETIAINLQRGTGWRGLSVFADTAILRPLRMKQKYDLYEYALANNLEWVEDETNQSQVYLRNRLRKRIHSLNQNTAVSLLRLRQDQVYLRSQIDSELKRYEAIRSRYFFIMLPDNVAIELLRSLTHACLTRPQLAQVLHAIKTARAGTSLAPGAGIQVQFTKTQFTFENTSQLLY
jgi:tRNA(Ile)-lysidine synthase